MKLTEQYKDRLAVASSVYEKAHGQQLSGEKKLGIAMLLNNVNKFMNEQFNQSVGTQRADLGAWKKFCFLK